MGWDCCIHGIVCLWKGTKALVNHFLAYVDLYLASRNKIQHSIQSWVHHLSNSWTLKWLWKIDTFSLICTSRTVQLETISQLIPSSTHLTKPFKKVSSQEFKEFVHNWKTPSCMLKISSSASPGGNKTLLHYVKQSWQQWTTHPGTLPGTLNPYRIPLVITYHLNSTLSWRLMMINHDPAMQDVISEPPIVSLRRPSNLEA